MTANVYDNRGNRVQRTQPNGAVTNYAYDAQGRLLSAVQDGAPLETRSYTYNAAGAVTFVAESTRATGYTLDKLGRTVEERTFVKNPLDATWIPKSVVTSTYDVVGNRLTVAYPENRGLSCTYDLRNLLTAVTDGTRTTAYGYDAAGNRTSMTMPNGVVASYTFDSNNRLTRIAHTNLGGTNLYSAQYTLDAAGMRTLVTETGVNRSTRALTFGYDNLYQLTSEADSSRNGGNPTLYTYDAMGNRLSKTDNGVTTTYTVDGLNRVTAATTGLEQVTYAYDANGSTASKTAGGVTRDYHYDRENRLVRVSEGEDDIFSAAYDYRCRRLEKTENGDTVSYLYDGGVSVQEYDAEGSLTTYFVRAGGYGGGIGDVVYKEKADGTGREFFLYNATGTTSALTNDAGTVTSTSCYTAWGTETATVGTTDNVRKFSTKERSEVLGIDYFGFRYYDPELGRFLTRDPSGYPDGPNNYLYCTNSPVNKIDPLGLESEETQAEKVKKEIHYEEIHDEDEKNELPGWGEMFKKTIGGMFDFKNNIKQSVQHEARVERMTQRIVAGMAKNESEAKASTAATIIAGLDMTGLTEINQGLRGINLATGEKMAPKERIMNLFTGGINSALLFGPMFLKPVPEPVVAQIKANTRFGPMNEGPLPKKIANTFRSGTYDSVTTTETTTLYRTTSQTGNALGQYWTRNKPTGPLQTTLDSAILPEWGNNSSMLHTLQVPQGTQFFEGIAGPQKGKLGGFLTGGGNQITFPDGTIKPEWLIKSESVIK